MKGIIKLRPDEEYLQEFCSTFKTINR